MLCVPVLVDLVTLCYSFRPPSDSQDVRGLCQVFPPPPPPPPYAIFLHFLMSNVKHWIKSWKSGARNRRCSRRSVVFTSLSWTCRNAALKKRISSSNNSLRSFIGWRPLEGRDHGCAHARRLSLQNKCVGSTLDSKSPLLVHSLKLLRFIQTSVALAGLVILHCSTRSGSRAPEKKKKKLR